MKSFRDATTGIVHEMKDRMSDTIFRRCKFVVEENDQLLKGCDALAKHDIVAFGQLLYETHNGLSRDYEVSCTESDFLVSCTQNISAVYGARIMGGGFGGCTLNLVKNDAIADVGNKIARDYEQRFGIALKMYATSIGTGTYNMHRREYETV